MKKFIIATLAIAMSSVLMAQKSTGVITLGDKMTAKIDLNITTSIVTLTMTGPPDRWFGLGFDTQIMKYVNGDVVIMTNTQLGDRHLGTSYGTPQLDAIQNWTLISNIVNNGVRNIVATRPFVGDGTYDYDFTSTLTSINLIWAYPYAARFEPADFYRHSNTTRGVATATFATLSTADLSTINKINLSSNPSTGMFTLTKDKLVVISSINVFDESGKLIKEVQTDFNSNSIAIDLSKLAKGQYFMEISNKYDKTVKKIIIE
jgi:Secretion system C-terminal sorting domain